MIRRCWLKRTSEFSFARLWPFRSNSCASKRSRAMAIFWRQYEQISDMIRSFAFTTQGRLHSKDIDTFLMPTLLADTNLFLWVDLEKPTQEETRMILEEIFHFHPLSIEDCVQVSPSPKVEEYNPKEGDLFHNYLFMVIHAV